jgi:ribose-phosphate pyrophosphokinase
MRIFSGSSHPDLANDICQYLGVDLGRMDLGRFPDTETKVQIMDDVRGMEAFVVQSVCQPVNESLMELLIITDALRRASAKSICAVIPYFGYARQDRKHAGRVPITAKLVANLIATSGVDRVLTMDLHATQIQGFFDIPVDHLFASPVLVEYLRSKQIDRPVIMSPDVGSLKMAHGFAKRLNGDLAVVEKRRMGDDQVEKGHVIGEIQGRNVIIVDDMISTAGSISQAIAAAKEMGAARVLAMASHGVFVGKSFERLRDAGADEIVVTDSIPLGEVPEGIQLTVLSVAELLGEAVTRIHRKKSVSLLFV